MTAVDEIQIPNGSISKSMIPTIAKYVKTLHQCCATSVYGRLDFYQFNLTALPGSSYGDCNGGPWADYNCPIYNQTRMYVKQLHLDGVWFDHPSQYYDDNTTQLCVNPPHVCGVGPDEFNQMMQNLTTMFNTTTFILNQTPGSTLGYVHQGNNDCGAPNGPCSWAAHSFVAPSPGQKSLNMSQQTLAIENGYFPGHVIVHLDAEGPPAIGSNPKEPMSVYAAENDIQEVSSMQNLLFNASNPYQGNRSLSYSMVIPFLGSWTCDCSALPGSPNYHGTLYNALNTGLYHRSMVRRIDKMIQNNPPPAATLSSASGNVGQTIFVSGSNFVGQSSITMSLDGRNLGSTSTDSGGSFATSVTIRNATGGSHTFDIINGFNVLSTSFAVVSKITDVPNSGGPAPVSVTINGYGFGNSVMVTLYFNGHKVGSSASDQYGYFRTTYQVSFPGATGNYVFKATDSVGNSATVTFTYNAT